MSLYPVPLIYGKDKLGLLWINQSNKWFGNFSFPLSCTLSLSLFLSFEPGEQSSTDTGKAPSRCWPHTRRGDLMLVKAGTGTLGCRLGMLLIKITAYGERLPQKALSKGCMGNYKFNNSEVGHTWLCNLKNVISTAYIMQYRLLKANQIQIRSYFPPITSFPSSRGLKF